ncbi:alkaline phosphatase D family protein [soil metagenome]
MVFRREPLDLSGRITFVPALMNRPAALIAGLGLVCFALPVRSQPYQGTGIKIGETDQTGATIWTRLTTVPHGDSTRITDAAPGAEGEVRVSFAPAADPDSIRHSAWHPVDPARDFTRQIVLRDLAPGTHYSLAVESRALGHVAVTSTVNGRFKTAPPPDDTAPVLGTIVTCQGIGSQDSPTDGHRVYDELAAIDPDFFVHTGDVLYYDKDYDGLHPLSKNPTAARQRWNRMFSYRFNQNFHRLATSYFLKDDHDLLKNDCYPGQTYGDLTFDQGVAIFAEQTPSSDLPYSTVRWGQDLQIWLLEEREFRSPNRMPDGPDKSILGTTQKLWLEQTLRASDATFKLVISPGPIVGPDKPGKADNLSNPAFQSEGDQIRALLANTPGTYVIAGDRHWQYASVDPVTGLQEFGCGPINAAHNYGGDPGRQPGIHSYFSPKGGYLSVRSARDDGSPALQVRWHDADAQDSQSGRFQIAHTLVLPP